MAINMYLLFVSIFGALVESTAVTVTLGVATIFYIAFIIYLVLEPAQEDGNWTYIKRTFLSSRLVISLVHFLQSLLLPTFSDLNLKIVQTRAGLKQTD